MSFELQSLLKNQQIASSVAKKTEYNADESCIINLSSYSLKVQKPLIIPTHVIKGEIGDELYLFNRVA